MKRINSKLWIAVFLMIIATPRITYFFLEKYVDVSNYENRTMVNQPVLSMDNYENFPRDYESFYNDNLPFRNSLIRLNNSIDYFLFKQSSNESVEIGLDGWFFYSNEADGNPVEQSLGYWEFSEEELKRILDNLQATKRVLDDLGIEFILFIAPNKETIYRENLPEYYSIKNEITAVDQLVAYLRDNSELKIVYPKEQLLENKKNFPEIILYHKFDTHWNNAAGYLGASYLADELKIAMPPLEEVNLEKYWLSSGDLTRLLNIEIKDGDCGYVISGINDLTVECEKYDPDTEFIYHTTGADERKLFVKRDSYASAMAPYLATQFNDCIFVHNDYFTQQQVIDYQADIFVLETVERYISKLKDFRMGCVSADFKETSNNMVLKRTDDVHRGG